MQSCKIEKEKYLQSCDVNKIIIYGLNICIIALSPCTFVTPTTVKNLKQVPHPISYVKRKKKQKTQDERRGVNDQERDVEMKRMWMRGTIGERDGRFYARNFFKLITLQNNGFLV